MLRGENRTIKMDEGDYGLNLPLIFQGDLESNDVIKFKIKQNRYLDESKLVLEKTFDKLDIQDNETICMLNFTKEESSKLTEGKYEYSIKQYREDKLLNTIASHESFIVEKGV